MVIFSKEEILEHIKIYKILDNYVADFAKEYASIRNIDGNLSSVSFGEFTLHLEYQECYDRYYPVEVPLRWLWEENWKDEIPALIAQEDKEVQEAYENSRQDFLDRWKTLKPEHKEIIQRRFNYTKAELKKASQIS